MSEHQNSPPRWRWIVPGLLLVVGTLFMMPGAIEVVRTPHRWHGFEVGCAGRWAAMIYMGLAHTNHPLPAIWATNISRVKNMPAKHIFIAS